MIVRTSPLGAAAGAVRPSFAPPRRCVQAAQERHHDRGDDEGIFFGGFERCDKSDPKSLKPGESYDTCLTYLIPKGGSVTGMRWVLFDQKTGESDINWK